MIRVTRVLRTGLPNFSHVQHITDLSSFREPSPIRALQPFLSLPKMISLGGGMPNPVTFPIETMSFKLKTGETLEVSPSETQSALQYSSTKGLPSLHKHLTALQNTIHSPPNDTDIIVTNGSQDALAKAFEMLLKPRSSLLVESPTYSGSLAFLDPLEINLVPVETDELGLIPSSLERVLSEFDESKTISVRKPKVIYTIPTGSNPSGGTLSLDRKKRLYELACMHDLIILEDDPYYYINFEEKRPPSLLSMDVESRVIRFDSFSKLMSAGMRVGFATGSPELIERMELHHQATLLHASGISQMCVSKLFDHWEGVGGFLGHCDTVTEFYRGQRDSFMRSAERHLGGLVELKPPTAGMFAWMKLNGVDDSEALVMEKAVGQNVLMVPGVSFLPRSRNSARVPTPYVRCSYSTATEEDIDVALERLSKMLKEVTGDT